MKLKLEMENGITGRITIEVEDNWNVSHEPFKCEVQDKIKDEAKRLHV